MEKLAWVVMLPIEKTTSLKQRGLDQSIYYRGFTKFIKEFLCNYIYFVSDEPGEEGDWVYYKNGSLRGIHQIKNGSRPKTLVCKKIIATDNPDLWPYNRSITWEYDHAEVNHGIGKIATNFIKDFIKSEGKINKVLIQYKYDPAEEFKHGKYYCTKCREWKEACCCVSQYKLDLNPDGTVKWSLPKLTGEEFRNECEEWLSEYGYVLHSTTINELHLTFVHPHEVNYPSIVCWLTTGNDKQCKLTSSSGFKLFLSLQSGTLTFKHPDLLKWIKTMKYYSDLCSENPPF
jgi:hypothetical protein